jgi:hypothetical protein
MYTATELHYFTKFNKLFSNRKENRKLINSLCLDSKISLQEFSFFLKYIFANLQFNNESFYFVNLLKYIFNKRIHTFRDWVFFFNLLPIPLLVNDSFFAFFWKFNKFEVLEKFIIILRFTRITYLRALYTKNEFLLDYWGPKSKKPNIVFSIYKQRVYLRVKKLRLLRKYKGFIKLHIKSLFNQKKIRQKQFFINLIPILMQKIKKYVNIKSN